VDIIADVNGQLIPFEVKYGETLSRLTTKGFFSSVRRRKLSEDTYHERFTDFTVSVVPDRNTRILQIPAPLACYWLGRSELEEGFEGYATAFAKEGAPAQTVFIVESVDFGSEKAIAKKGKFLSQILNLCDKESEYRYVRTKQQFVAMLDEFSRLT